MKKLYALLFVCGISYAEDHTVPPVGVVANHNTQQLCVPNYTTTIRPPVSYTNGLKKAWVPAGHKVNEFELDHFIPLVLGGDPKSPDNLWLEKWDDARIKDKMEVELHHEVCAGKITLQQAQQSIRSWK